MRLHHFIHGIVSVLLLLAGARAQKPATPPAAAQPAPAIMEESLPLTPDRRAQIRELQYQFDQAQIQIEQIKQKQIQWTNDISLIATEFARIQQVDISAYELDSVNLRLIKKKIAPAISPAPATKPPQPIEKKSAK